MFARLRSMWDALFKRLSLEERMDQEMRFHLESMMEDLIRSGLSREEAERQARLRFGGVEVAQEQCREARGMRGFDRLRQDIRYAARMLRRNPGFAIVSVLTLALGTGVNAAILSAVHGVVLRPLSVDRPTELIAPHWGRKADARVWGGFSYANFVDLREQNRSFSDLCAWDLVSAALSSGESRNADDSEHAEVAWGELVSGNYFDVMGVKPLLGRNFLPEEDCTPNARPVVVLGHSLWQRRFKADRGIVGQTVYLNGQPFTVIGVMPESFLGSVFILRTSFWAPAMMAQKFGTRAEWQTDRGYALFNLYGRLKPGLTIAQAEADLNLVAERLAKLYPQENAGTKIQLTTEVDGRYSAATKIIKYGGLLAVGVSGLVLLLACANVANLMLARAAARAKEIGIRLAIGAGRGRIVQQLLTESVLLALLGGALGLAFAYGGARVIRATVPPVQYPVSFDFAPDGYVLRWMLVVSLCTGLIFGLAPALLASRTDLLAVIKGAVAGPSRGRRRWNLRGALVVAQVTISIIVLICAGLFIRSLSKARQTDPGFQTDKLVTMRINLDALAYDENAMRRFWPELQRRTETQPGVRTTSLASALPLWDSSSRSSRGPIVKEGEADPPPNQGVNSECSFVMPKYFDTLRTPLVLGRDFTDHDTADAPRVVIVNQEFARRFYGGAEQALGKRFRFAPQHDQRELMEIIGIAKDGRYRTLYEDWQPYLFLPVAQHPRANMALLISAQPTVTLSAVVESARREIARMDSRLPAFGVMVEEENLAIAFWGPSVAAGMASTFGLLALALATMGLYSVMMYSVSHRTREIGIRMALGASLREVLLMVVRQGMQLALLGITLGLAVAWTLTRVLASLLLGVGATDAVTFVGVTALLVMVALLACAIPARRATRVDPLIALRQE
jgi:predicted permease